ncbi:MAG: hypothetical protein ACM31C_13845 [Acidobacteriota bacterium]
MGRQTVILELAVDPAVARDLAAGGVFVPGCTVGLDQDCELVVRGAGDEVTVAARVVFVDGRGAGLQLICDAAVLQQIAQMASPAEPEPEPEPDPDAEGPKIALNVQQRLRGLTLAQQVRIAQRGEVQERIVLERMYGKNVWESLLHNPRLTGPEVARIARMGTLPRVLVEVIVGNGAWLQIPEVRRALLSNPRLGVDQIVRVLRLLPKHELKLAASQTAYPFAVRDQAKRMLRDGS